MSGDADEVLLNALLAAARRRRAARERADQEFEEGTWATIEDEPEQLLRLAAEPAAGTARSYRSGALVVELRTTGHGLEAVQIAGPAGITLLAGGARVPLTAGVATLYPAGELPTELRAIDSRGRWLTLG